MSDKAPIWITRIIACPEVYNLQVGDDPEVGSDDTYLVLDADNGAQYRLQLSHTAASSLLDCLASALTSKAGKVQ